jgi:hypothetical protein
MKRIYYRLLTLLFFAALVSGCKLDAPLNSDGTTLGGTKGNFVNYTFQGKTVKMSDLVFFQVIAPGVVPDGSTQIIAGTDPTNAFSIMASTAVAGTFPAEIISIGSDFIGEGTVIFTEISSANGLNGTVKGTFTGQMFDKAGVAAGDISGSFSIKN